MPEIHFKISPSFADRFQNIVEATAENLGRNLAVSLDGLGETDLELIEVWESGLSETLASDIEQSLHLFKSLGSGTNSIFIDEASCIPLMRATSALRLRLQEVFLQQIPNQELEMGEVDFEQLDSQSQDVYSVYFLLAIFQEQIIAVLDLELGSG